MDWVEQSGKPDEFTPLQVVSPFPVIQEPETIPGKEVKEQVLESELVLGVVVGEEARAYPINMLTGPSREIINDSLGGQWIAATW